MSYERALPIEQWQQVFVNVPPGDLCNVVRTSRYMYSVASWPDLWAGMKVNMGKVREVGLTELYSINRFKKITKMDFSDMYLTFEQLERLLTDIPGSPLENIDLSYVNLLGVPAELLARTVSHLQTVNLCGTRLTTDQCDKLLEASFSSSALIDVNLTYVNLLGVPAELLARAVSRLQTVNLCSTRLTTDQCDKMLEASFSSTVLVDVNVSDVNLSRVPAELLARAVSRLQTVNLCSTRLTTDQCVKVLEASISSAALVDVNLSSINLSRVPAELLARAVSRLITVYLRYTQLTTNHCVKVLDASLSSSTLVNIDLHFVNLRKVPAELLARAVSRLTTVNLCNTRLTSGDCVKVLEASLSSSTLVNIDLNLVNLREVPAELLASAVSRLTTVNLCRNPVKLSHLSGTELTTDQCVKVLEISLSSTTLVNIDLQSVNLGEVPAELLARAVSRLQTVNLSGTELTTDQCVKVLEASLSSSTLVKLDLEDIDLSKVPVELLASLRVSGLDCNSLSV